MLDIIMEFRFDASPNCMRTFRYYVTASVKRYQYDVRLFGFVFDIFLMFFNIIFPIVF